MQLASIQSAVAYAAGLALTLFLAAYLTPRSWWKRPNLRALLILCVGAWTFGGALLYLAPALQARPLLASDSAPHAEQAPAPATSTATAHAAPATGARSAATLIAGQPFLTHRDLNLRAAAGVHAARVAVVPAGASVTPTGMRDGDWWQISAHVAGHAQLGWVSSLWLRRSGE